MDKDGFRRIIQGVGANAYGQGVAAVVQLVTVPVLLHAWGAALYGEWLILAAIPAYLSMTDLGFSQSAANDMTHTVAREDRGGALAVYHSLLALVFAASGIGLLVVSALLFGLPLDRWLHFHGMDTATIRWVLWLLAAEVLVKLPDGATHAGFRSNGDYALHVSINNTTILLQFVGIWAAALTGLGPVAAAACFFAVRVFGTAFAGVMLVHRHPWLQFSFKHARRAELRRLLRPAIANLGLPLAFALRVQGMVLVVGALLGPVAVVVFSTLRTLTNLAFRMVTTISHAAEPELAGAYGANRQAALRALYVHTLRTSLWFALGAIIVLVLAGSWIVTFWTGGAVVMNDLLFDWLLAAAGASVLWYVPLTVLKAANRHLRAVGVFVGSAAAAVALAWVLLHGTERLADVGVALLVTDVAMALYAMRTSAKLCGVRPQRLVVQAANPLPMLQFAWSRTHVR